MARGKPQWSVVSGQWPVRATVMLVLAVAACTSSVPGGARAQAPGPTPPPVPLAPAYGRGGVALAELVAGLGNTTRVLMIAAHPDDEDNRLLAWLSRGQHIETAYLSLTRGDGGQNLIGNELGEGLGVIRTEELLAARRVDGAHQYFARAYDFGFSKSAEESYTHWPHDSLLGDVVTIVRAFRPHVVIAVFTGTPQDGHGQHQVSAILAREAYDLSGDTVRFPVAKYGTAWTAAKFYRDRSYFGGGDNALSIPTGSYDPLLGYTYAEIAAVSRSQHRSQGQGGIGPTGPVRGTVYREATRVNASTPAGQERSMLDGIDTTWNRFAGTVPDGPARSSLDSIPLLIGQIQARFMPAAPDQVQALLGALGQHLLEARRGSMPLANATSKASRAVNGDGSTAGASAGVDPDFERTLDVTARRTLKALTLASGAEFYATVARDVAAVTPVVAGQRRDSGATRVAVAATNHGRAPLTVLGFNWRTQAFEIDSSLRGYAIAPDSTFRDTIAARDSVVSQPWWLRTPRHGDLFGTPVSRVAEDERIVAAVALEVRAGESAGHVGSFDPWGPIVQRVADPTRGEIDRPLAFVPAISLTLDRTVEYAPAGRALDRTERVLLRSGLDSAREVTVSLGLPKGVVADSAIRRVVLPAYGALPVAFRVRGTLPPGEARLSATATSNGQSYRVGYVPIEYEHIRPQKLYRPVDLRLSAVDVKVPTGLAIGYIPGVGDNVEPTLEQLGLRVTVLDPGGLRKADLSRFTTIVVGPRAYQASAELKASNSRLLDFARRGGTLVVQYGQYEMAEPGIMPYPITLNRPADRVTDENAPVKVLDPQSPLLNGPNKIAEADWADWVQERSLYMPRTHDSHYHAVLAMSDPGEPPNDGAILVASLGSGTYVYTTLAFFRQMPAGVPGAARLFVNLLAAGRR